MEHIRMPKVGPGGRRGRAGGAGKAARGLRARSISDTAPAGWKEALATALRARGCAQPSWARRGAAAGLVF